MPSVLNLRDFLINKLSEHNGVFRTLIPFSQRKEHEASLTLSLSWTQALLAKHTS